jgi:cytosine/uracil/thiamine/allantoin permease
VSSSSRPQALPETPTEVLEDSRLIPAALVPASGAMRELDAARLACLWIAFGAASSLRLGILQGQPLAATLLAVLCGAAAAGLVGLGSSWGARQAGAGAVPLTRAAFGARAAILPLLLRWAVGVYWGAVIAADISHWAAALVEASARALLATVALPPRAVTEAVTTLVLVALAMLPAKRSLARLAKISWSLAILALVAFGALLVFGGIASQGFAAADASPQGGGFVRLVCDVALLCLPAALGVADWQRLALVTPGAERRRQHVAPVAALAAGLALAFCGALSGRAAAILAAPLGSAIAHGAAFAGIAGASVGLVATVALWLVAAPLIALRDPALAAVGIYPLKLGFRGALWLSAAGVVAAAQAERLAILPAATPPGLALVSLAGVLLGDGVRRQGRLAVTELYRLGGRYGACAGWSPAAVFAWVAGLTVAYLQPAAFPEGLAWRVLVSAGVAAILTITLGWLEDRLSSHLRRGGRRPPHESPAERVAPAVATTSAAEAAAEPQRLSRDGTDLRFSYPATVKTRLLSAEASAADETARKPDGGKDDW